MKDVKCLNCQHFSKDIKAGPNQGFCLYNPPQVFFFETGIQGARAINAQSVSPAVSYENRCSKYRERE